MRLLTLFAALVLTAGFTASPAHGAIKKAATDPVTVGYSHINELDFHPKPENRAVASRKYPVLRSEEPCIYGYTPRVFARYSTTKPVLVCW